MILKSVLHILLFRNIRSHVEYFVHLLKTVFTLFYDSIDQGLWFSLLVYIILRLLLIRFSEKYVIFHIYKYILETSFTIITPFHSPPLYCCPLFYSIFGSLSPSVSKYKFHIAPLYERIYRERGKKAYGKTLS